VVFLSVYCGILLLSVPLHDRLFLIAGVVGFYTFLFRLTFDTAAGSPILPLAFTAIGVSLIVLAMLYQRARQAWVTNLP